MSDKKPCFDTQLDAFSFPHTAEKGRIKATKTNLKHLFESYGITCQYDEILKKQIISITYEVEDSDLSDNALFQRLKV